MFNFTLRNVVDIRELPHKRMEEKEREKEEKEREKEEKKRN